MKFPGSLRRKIGRDRTVPRLVSGSSTAKYTFSTFMYRVEVNYGSLMDFNVSITTFPSEIYTD